MRQTAVQVQEAATPAECIVQVIEELPGLSIQAIADHVGASRSAVRYHINRLVGDSLVAVQHQGNHRLHFTASMPAIRRRAIALLRLASMRSVMATVMRPQSIEGQGQGILFSPLDVAKKSGVSRSCVYRNLKVIERAGLARTARARGAYSFWPHPELRLTWVLYCKDAPHTPPLRPAPIWMLGFELLLGKLALGDWAAS